MSTYVEKCLGQSKPNATTETTLYTVPAATSTVCTALTVCNQSATATTFRVSIAVGGGATDVKDYQFYDYPIDGNETLRLTNLRWTLAATDKVKIYTTLATVSFSLYGSEKS